ncbi:hypothetical protein BDV93DRAFT_548520 [Ceratobasidium sp. AG-I]|nr:hypothetical protein BDV93DRAFT_548520 [Ceratobasidium sp. AG-I]
MYTPTRRSSVSESPCRFTPSKRGQAALDAYALGYDVHLPDYSIALLPRSAVSEQALSSFTPSPHSAEHERALPRSTSLIDSSRRDSHISSQGSNQRNSRSDEPDRKRFAIARHIRSPRGEGVLYSSASDHSSQQPSLHLDAPNNTAQTPRPSTLSLPSSTPQYVLTSPKRDQEFASPTHQERVVAALTSLYTPRSMPRSPLQTGYPRRHSLSHNHSSPSNLPGRPIGQARTDVQHPVFSPTDEFASTSLHPGPTFVPYVHNRSTHNSPQKPTVLLSEAAKLRRSPDQPMKTLLPSHLVVDRPTQRFTEEAANESRHLQNRSGSLHSFMARPPRDNDNGDTAAVGQQNWKPPVSHHSSISGPQRSPVYQNTRLPDDRRLFVDTRVSDNIHFQHHYSNSDSSVNPRGSFHSRPPSQRQQFAPSLAVPSIAPSHAAPSPLSSTSAYTIPSPYNGTNQLPKHISSQTYGMPPSRTPSSSSRATPPYGVGFDDEAFRVHPERAVLSRMESLLMLSVCRNEVDGRKFDVAGHGYNEFSGGSLGLLDGEDAFTVVPNRGAQPGGYNARGPGHLGDMRNRNPQTTFDAPREPGFQAGSPNHQRIRARQRSGSMHALSPQRNGLPAHGSPQRGYSFQSPQRQRLRSTSLIVQGLSPEAVKKLRVYETLKCRGEGKEGSLRELAGVVERDRPRPAKEARTKKSEKLGSTSKMVLPPTSVPIPVSPAEPPISLEPSKRVETMSVNNSNSPLFAVPVSPTQVPLPSSPVGSPSSNLPFSPSQSQTALASFISPLVSSESFIKYQASQGVESPRPIRTRQNTANGRVGPTFRVVSSPEKAERLTIGPVLETLEPKSANLVDESHGAYGRGLNGSGASLRGLGICNETLRVEPNIERILTPPPSFWSPPPLSAIIRTSALLPSANLRMSGLADPIARTSSAALPVAIREVPVSLQRPMSVPASNDMLRAGVSGDVHRAWSCELANGGVGVGKSFAGDWTQCMVIDLSDEEDEGEGAEMDDSEGEDDGSRPQMANGRSAKRDAEGLVGDCTGAEGQTTDRVTDNRANQRRRDVRNVREGAEYYMHQGGSNSSSGSAANAVEVVQNAIVKLAIDNAGVNHMKRIQSLHNRLANIPSRSATLGPNYPAGHFHKLATDPLQSYGAHQLRDAVNNYFDAPRLGSFQPIIHSHGNAFPRSNPALDSLRSGLELRAAASVSAVEEAVRARSASPSLPNQEAHKLGMRAISGSTLPPRLQRLQAMQAWTHSQAPAPYLDTPAFPKRGPTSRPPVRQHVTSSSQPSRVPQPTAPLQARHIEHLPPVDDVPSSSQRGVPPETSAAPPVPQTSTEPQPRPSDKQSHLSNIVVEKGPVPPAPMTAPLARPRGRHQKRRSAEASPPKTRTAPRTPTKQPPNTSSPTISTTSTVPASWEKASTVGSPQQPGQPGQPGDTFAKSRSKANYWKDIKARRKASPKKQAPTPALPSAPPNPPPSKPLPPNPPSTNPPPTQVSPAQPLEKAPAGGVTTGGANKRRKYYKKSKPTKPSTSTSAG